MAFEIGERVSNSFTGPGTVVGPLERPYESDNDRTPYQRIKFDHPLFGERLHTISNLNPYDAPKPKSKAPKLTKTKADLAFDEALASGLTFFTTRKDIKNNDPNLGSATFIWLGVELANLPTNITIYATKKNKDAIAASLAELLSITPEEALTYITVRERVGGSKWNVDFPNFPDLTPEVRDALNVNFSHNRTGGERANIKRIRCGCTKLVQELIRSGFGSSIQKAGGDGTKTQSLEKN